MPTKKRLAVFIDGTWQNEKSKHTTNIVKMKDAVVAAGSPTQLVCYLAGPGAHVDKPRLLSYTPFGLARYVGDRIFGGINGVGVGQDIVDGYAFLAKEYSDGDDIFIFGFSRGAFAARSLSGLIAFANGIPSTAADAEKSFEAYKDRDPSKLPAAASFRPARVHFLGVFDTVGSMGVPFREHIRDLTAPKWPDVKLGDHIDIARHALAVDERRQGFSPSIWTPVNGVDSQQVWFPGDHCDVGGGHADDTLSKRTLAWMSEEASAAGLQFASVPPSERTGAHVVRSDADMAAAKTRANADAPALDGVKGDVMAFPSTYVFQNYRHICAAADGTHTAYDVNPELPELLPFREAGSCTAQTDTFLSSWFVAQTTHDASYKPFGLVAPTTFTMLKPFKALVRTVDDETKKFVSK